ncbi:MAG: hypothetical protein K2M73_03980 [Lachnospiraceae bacterium]|nr:hypothetical protein [Lachnospiraceae bacterium]
MNYDETNEEQFNRRINQFEKKANRFFYKLKLFVIAVTVIALFCGGIFLILAYGIPLGNRKQDMKQVFNGIGIIGMLILINICYRLIGWFFGYLDRKHGDFSKEINSKKLPAPFLRTLKHTLIYMSGKIFLKVYDGIVWSFVIAIVLLEIFADKLSGNIVALLIMIGICLFVRVCIVAVYYFKNYTKKMLRYCEKYIFKYEGQLSSRDIEESIKKSLMYYSRQLVITKDYILAWCETDALYHPIAVPFNEIILLQYEVRSRATSKGAVIYSAVLVCKLRSGKTVDLYVGNRFKTDVIWRVLKYFNIQFENRFKPETNSEV